ncbi:MAG: GH116 family glycosyl hydrolase, partial [Anaerolineales bacterium]|nr:GH116 family glycosyl hydrolase [Anaerolineales bacterium]
MKAKKNRPSFWSGAVFGIFAGIASLISYQYITRILREPRLISKAIFSDEEHFETVDALAKFIAAESLRSGVHTRLLARGVNKEILHAGYRNFRECWARDFGFASYGLIAIEELGVVRDTLEAFFWHQTSDGQLPVKLHSMDFITRFLHSLFGREQPTEKILKPKFISAHGAPSLDGHALLIIAALHYIKETEDSEFLQRYWEKLTLAMKWLENSNKAVDDVLLHQKAYADWVDSVERHGVVLYTNVVYWKALTEMAHTAASLDSKDEAAQYSAIAERVSRAIVERLWRPDLGYFAT